MNQSLSSDHLECSQPAPIALSPPGFEHHDHWITVFNTLLDKILAGAHLRMSQLLPSNTKYLSKRFPRHTHHTLKINNKDSTEHQQEIFFSMLTFGAYEALLPGQMCVFVYCAWVKAYVFQINRTVCCIWTRLCTCSPLS